MLKLRRPVERARLLEADVRLVEAQRRERVLDRVVRLGLDVLLEDEPGEEAEREPPLPRVDKVQVDRVDDLFGRDEDVWRRSVVRNGAQRERWW